MKKNTFYCILSLTILIVAMPSCENKKTKEEKLSTSTESDSIVNQKIERETNQPEKQISYQSYKFAENLKEDSFFESDNINKEIELKNIGISGYMINGDEVILNGVFYDKEGNKAIPRLNNNPPGRAFVSEYYNKKEITYDEKYKTTYSATLYIILKNPRHVQKLKMYVASEPVLNYEYKVPESIDEFKSGFIDLVNIKGTFIGKSAASNYPNIVYEFNKVELY